MPRTGSFSLFFSRKKELSEFSSEYSYLAALSNEDGIFLVLLRQQNFSELFTLA